jgi:hypothetical protein
MGDYAGRFHGNDTELDKESAGAFYEASKRFQGSNRKQKSYLGWGLSLDLGGSNG